MNFDISPNQHRQLVKLLKQHQRGKLIPQWAHDAGTHLENNTLDLTLANPGDQRKTLNQLMRDSDHNLLII